MVIPTDPEEIYFKCLFCGAELLPGYMICNSCSSFSVGYVASEDSDGGTEI